MTYALRVKFKSNEAPWSGGYEPNSWHQPLDDEAAIKWAVGMSDGLGFDYLVTLIKDGTVIPLPIRQISAAVLADPFAPENLCDCVGPNEAEPQPCHCGRK